MNKRTKLVFAASAIILAAASSAYAASDYKFKTSLWGTHEIPMVDTSTSGKFKIEFDMADNMAPFELRVKDGMRVTEAHIHCGAIDQNGPPVVTLLGHVPGGFDLDGRLAKFEIRQENILSSGLECATPITTLDQLRQAALEGMLYVNIHTTAHPMGEVRGQLWQD